MATLKSQTDIMAALEKKKKQLQAAKKQDNKEAIAKFTAQIKKLNEGIKTGKTVKDVTAKQLANSLLASRKKFLEMSKKDFNGVIRQLSKKPEYSFLKAYTRDEVVRDIQRKAKPVGWRFKGRGNYKTPTKKQVRERRGIDVYYENRPNRSDVSQARQLEKGGGVTESFAEWKKRNGLKIEKEGNLFVVVDKNGLKLMKAEYKTDLAKMMKNLYMFAKYEGTSSEVMYAKGGSTYARGGEIDTYFARGKYADGDDFHLSGYLNLQHLEDEVYSYGNELDQNTISFYARYNDGKEEWIADSDYPTYAKGGGVMSSKQLEKGGYANAESPKHVLHIDGQNWYLEKIDSTHFYMSNSPDHRGMAHHVGQHKGEPYYEEVREWLKTTKMAKGGGVSDNFRYAIIVTNTQNPYDNQSRVATVGRKGDAIIMLTALQIAAKNTPLDYSIVELYEDGGFVPMSMSDLKAMRAAEYEPITDDNYEDDEDAIVRYYFEEEPQYYAEGGGIKSAARRGAHKAKEAGDGVADWAFNFDPKKRYEDGGEVDINDLDIPVHYTMFEDEMYEFAKGGGVGEKYEVTFEDVFSFATMKKTGVLTDKQYKMALRQKKNKDVVIDKFNKSQGIREQYRIKDIKKIG